MMCLALQLMVITVRIRLPHRPFRRRLVSISHLALQCFSPQAITPIGWLQTTVKLLAPSIMVPLELLQNPATIPLNVCTYLAVVKRTGEIGRDENPIMFFHLLKEIKWCDEGRIIFLQFPFCFTVFCKKA